MADVFDTISIEPETKRRDIFDTIQAPLERQLGAFRGAGATGTWDEEPTGLLPRFGKQFYNVALAQPAQAIATESRAGRLGTLLEAQSSLEQQFRGQIERGEPVTKQQMGFYTKPYSKWSLGGILKKKRPEWAQQIWQLHQAGGIRVGEPKKITPQETKDLFKEAKANAIRQDDVSAYVSEASNLAESAVDVVAGISGFMFQLAALRRAFPAAHPAVIWEIQNQVTGGTPGSGLLTYGAFTGPGKIIKGTTKAAQAGRIITESASLATLSAIEQKINTGEIDPVQIGIAAALPFALRTPKAIKSLIRKRNPKVMKAIAEVTMAKPVTKVPIDDANKAITAWSKKAKMLNKTERKVAVHKLRQRQAAAGKERYKLEREAGTPRLLAFRRARKAYKGKAAVPEIEPLKLTPEQQELYGRKIEQVYPAEYQFQRTGAAEAITKMTEGRIPTNYEFGLLEPIFGRDTTKRLFGELIKKRPFSGWELPALVIQAFKSKFGLDIQMFRQARSLAVRHPVLYLKSSWVNARAYISNKYAERMYTQVKNSPGYMESEKLGWNYVGEAGYSSKRLEYYALGLTERLITTKFKSPKLDKTVGASMRAWGKLLGASERGAVAGINNMQKSLYDIAAKSVRRLNLTPAQQKLWMKNRAKTHNTFIKILRVPPGKQYQGLRKLKQVANYLLFSPSMTIGRPLSIKALVANKGSRKYAAGVIASNIASIYAITAIPTIIGHKMRLQNPEEEPDVNGELNVLDGNWGKIRYGDTVSDFSGGDAPFYRTLARIGVSAYMKSEGAITGKVVTDVAGKRVPDAGETLKRYIETRETAALGYADTMLTGKDWMGEPIPRLEATVRALSPELIEAVVEAGMADGLWMSLASFAAASTSVGVTTYPVKAAATRSKFRDIVSQTKHNMDWDELSMSQQNRLRSEHRKQFDVLSERVRKERVGKPISIEKIKEEELRAGKRITGMLSKPNRQWVEDISIGVSRRPKNWYLTDKRYNRYQELVAQFVDEKLSRVDFTGMEDKRRVARVQVIVKVAKNKALATLRREMGR